MNKRGQDIRLVFDQYGPLIAKHVKKALDEASTLTNGQIVVVASDGQENSPATGNTAQTHHVYHTMESLSQLLAHRLEQMKQADLLVAQEKKETQTANKDRDIEALSVRGRLIRLRSNLEGAYGPDFCNEVGLYGETPDDPRILEQVVQSLLKSVGKDGFVLPAPLDPEMPAWTVPTLKSYLEKMVKPLNDALQTAARESKEDQDAQIQRRAALESTRLAVTAFTSMLETLSRLANLPEVADRIRPTVRSTSANPSNGDESPSATTPDLTTTPDPTTSPDPNPTTTTT